MLVRRMLGERKELFDHPIDGRIIYAFGIFDEAYKALALEDEQVELREDFPESELASPLEHFPAGRSHLVVLDDLQWSSAARSSALSKLFALTSHHSNITVILVLQDFYQDNPHVRTATRNATSILLTSTLRNRQTIATISRQAYPHTPNFIADAYAQAMQGGRYAYLLLDFHPTTPERIRVRANAFLPPNVHVYLPSTTTARTSERR